MATSMYFGPINIEDFLVFKDLPALKSHEKEQIQKIASIEVGTDWKEAKVRAAIIDPIVSLLGYNYSDGSFKPEPERNIKFQNRNNEIDYSLTLWEKDFWIIEAKRPRRSDLFPKTDLFQAIRYSAHPEINAALFVLCDGLRFQVWDREISLTDPLETFTIKNLVEDFDKIRSLFSPWNAWFFQKRRIVRNFKQTLSHEKNYKRVDELKSEVLRTVDSMRPVVLKNYQSHIHTTGERAASHELELNNIAEADIRTIVEGYFYFKNSSQNFNACSKRLVNLYNDGNSHNIVHYLFPSKPRYVNYLFFANCLNFLLQLSKSGTNTINVNPTSLKVDHANSYPLDELIIKVIENCLDLFREHPAYSLMLKYGFASRRLTKCFLLVSPEMQQAANIRHVLTRYRSPETSFQNIISSEPSQMLGLLEEIHNDMSSTFARSNFIDVKTEKTVKAKADLDSMLELESQLLSSEDFNYKKLVKELELNEVYFPTENVGTILDPLAFMTLAILKTSYPEHLKLVQERIETRLEFFGKMRIPWALQILDVDCADTKLPSLSIDELHQHFGTGKIEHFKKILPHYKST